MKWSQHFAILCAIFVAPHIPSEVAIAFGAICLLFSWIAQWRHE